ncbi:MAG: HEPN domain-containing protein [Nitrospira sp.]|jgi:HEPN domain-containing protein|nr:HEPN domain-containing protein [Nitrospira sp.]
MKRPEDLARRFLALADRDIRAFRKLSDDPEIDDEIVGFHAQQAVEKCLKAVLTRHRIEQRKTHDLQLLIDLLIQNKIPSPPLCEGIDTLGPFAVELRYDLMATESLDRGQARAVVEAVRSWAEQQVS